jgi:hypothetical protein
VVDVDLDVREVALGTRRAMCLGKSGLGLGGEGERVTDVERDLEAVVVVIGAAMAEEAPVVARGESSTGSSSGKIPPVPNSL